MHVRSRNATDPESRLLELLIQASKAKATFAAVHISKSLIFTCVSQENCLLDYNSSLKLFEASTVTVED